MPKLGILWFDNDPNKSIEAKINGAIEFYKKYQKEPNLIYVHPHELVAEFPVIVGAKVEVSRTIQPNHVWVGVETN